MNFLKFFFSSVYKNGSTLWISVYICLVDCLNAEGLTQRRHLGILFKLGSQRKVLLSKLLSRCSVSFPLSITVECYISSSSLPAPSLLISLLEVKPISTRAHSKVNSNESDEK